MNTLLFLWCRSGDSQVTFGLMAKEAESLASTILAGPSIGGTFTLIVWYVS